MRYYILLLLFTSFLSYSQDRQIDSLKRVLIQYEKVSNVKNDTLRILTLLRIANNYITIKPDSAISFSQKAIKFCSNSIYYERYLDKSYLILGVAFATKGFHESAIPTYYKALTFAQKYHHILYKGLCYKFIGDSYLFRNQFQQSEENYKNALKSYRLLGDSSKVINVYNLLGNVYFHQKKYPKAYKLYQKGENKTNIGHSLLYLGKEKEGLKLMLSNIPVLEEAKSNFQITLIYLNISKYYKQANNLTLSNEYAHKVMDITVKNSFQNEQMLASEILSQNYDELGNKEKALVYLKIHQNLLKITTEQSQKELLNSLKFEYDLRTKQEELQSTNVDLQSATKAKYYAFGIALFLITLLSLIAFYNRQINKTKQLIVDKNDKLELAQNQLTELNQNLEQKVTERTSDLQKANQELIQKNQEIVEAMFKGQTFERKQVAAELHDNLGSQLSAMRWSILAMNKASMDVNEREIYENVLSMMDESYNQIRNISHNLLPEELEKEGLQKAVEKLIHKLNRNQSIAFSLNFSEYSQPLNSTIALEVYAIILELVNNIIRHSNADKASITFSNSDKNLRIQVIDNGVGLNPTHFDEGIGFRNIKERVNKIGATIDLRNLKGLQATIHI
jgi:signal transduction histidine kinase